MIHYLKHNEIDRQRWDDCVGRAVNSRIYAWSWYLDFVCPEWEALVEEDYSSIFPLTRNTKWGIRYLYQPYFAQQLGLFSVNSINGDMVKDFIGAIPAKFRFIQIHLNTCNEAVGNPDGITTRLNHELDLGPPCDSIISGYSQNTRRNIRKAVDAGVTVMRKTDANELVELFRSNFGAKERKLVTRHYHTMRNLIRYMQENIRGQLTGAYSADKMLSAAAFFVRDMNRIYFLFAASSPQARENGAMFLLIDRFIHDHCHQPIILDFEGGNDPNLGRFYKGFGAGEVKYPVLTLNRLPWIVPALAGLKRKFRK